MSIKQDVFTSLAERVAESLPGNWSVDPFPENWGRAGAYLREERSQAVLVLGESQEYADRSKNKLTIVGDYPRDRRGQVSQARRPKITVSAAKTAAQIAADVQRRLLPEYLPLLERKLASSARQSEHEEKTADLTQKISEVVRVPIKQGETTVQFYQTPYKIFRGTMSHAAVHGDDDVELSLRLRPETALQVLNILIHGSNYKRM